MSAHLRQDVDFQGLFKKLGHNLSEIRIRALENLLSKLEHKLICDADLINERHLLIRLLEWFNFPDTSNHGDVLRLLQRLSQHTPAAEILQDIGAIEFLSTFRSDVSGTLQPVVDQILENTMRLPDLNRDDHIPQCVYQKQGDNTGSCYPVETVHDSVHTQSLTSANNIPPVATPHIVSGKEAMGYFTAKDVEVIQQQQEDNWSEQSDSFNMTVFPWLALTPTDRHVIMSTNSSLQSREPHLLVNSCDFLSDVVFQDFPAEIFLQRPNIVKNLLSILGSPSVSNTQLIVHASRTLGDLAACLKSRIKYYQDPALYTPKQDAGSSSGSQFSSSPSAESNQSAHSDARQSLIGLTDTRHSGDGRDGDSSTSSSRSSLVSSVGLGGPDATTTREETDLEDMPTLQYSQMSLPQFCTQVLQKSLPLLKTGEEDVVIQLLYLLDQIIGILGSVVTPHVWQDTSSNAREIVERLMESFGILSELIVFHHHSNRNLGNEKGDLIQHRLALIGVAGILSRILKQLVPFQMVRGILPESVTSAINLLVFDEGLSHSYPDVQIILLAYLQQIDHTKYKTYTDTAHISQSMQKSCKFLMLCQEEAYKGSSELIHLAESAIQSLPYHQHLTLVTEFIKLSSSICARTMDSGDLQTKCRNVLLKFLAHPLSNVRQQSYNTIYQVIKGSLSVNEASDPSSRACFLSRFIFDTEVLYEIIVFGLSDKDKKVSSAANMLIHHILESQLLMTSELWQEFLTCLLKTLPILQSYTDIDTDLGQTILSMVEPQNKTDTGVLPHLEKLRGTLRLMFCSDIRTRAEALKRLAWFLSNEENSNNKLPVFSSLDVTNLTNIFVMETPRSVDEDLGRSVFQIDGLRKVFEIFTSSSVDPGVKKSAVDQLAIILQDHNLHTAFKNEGGLVQIMDHIELGILKQENPQSNNCLQYLPACVTILRYLIHYDYTLRHKLAYETQIYINLLRVAFLHQKEQRVCYDVAHIFTLLLFDEVAKFELGGGLNPVIHFSVPLILTKRYRLPFRPSCHHDNSIHVTALPPDPDSLQTGPPSEMLRVIWNVAWHGSMDKLLDHLKKQKGQNEAFSEFSTKLKLTVTDRVLLQCSHLKRGIQQAVYDISNATSHKHVSSSLKRLLSYLVVSTGCHGTDLFFGMDWFPAVGRFLKVTPSSTPDESLLHEVLSFICMTIRLTSQVPDKTLQLLGDVLYQPSGPLIGLLHRASVQGEPRDVPENVNIKRSLDKELLSFIATYNSKLPYQLCRRLKFHQLRGDLSHQLLLRLNVTDAPHFYNLASLEGTLQCLMHITARPGWSSESSEIENITLCSQLLTSLLEVVSAFHIGRGGTSMSYMGKGVTKSATLCLRHLAYEMATVNEDKDWPRQWCYQQQKTDSTDAELNWMLTLWAYRDPEVRAAGLGIAVALTSVETGRVMITSHCRHIPGGIWGAAFSILLDQSECSIVRQQAALLLVNLTSQTMPVGSVELEQNVWQGPVVTDTEFEVSLVGLTALLALIHHSQFYQEMLILISNFYAQPSIYPVMVDFPHQQLSNTTTDYTFSTIADESSGLQQKFSHSGSEQASRDKLLNVKPQNVDRSSPGNVLKVDTPSSTSDKKIEYQSIVTPCLVSSVCQLLRNLVVLAPQDTFVCLKRDSFVQIFMNMIDTGLLEAYMTEMEREDCNDQLDLVFCDLLLMYDNILCLLKACVVYDTPSRQEVLSNSSFLMSASALLTIKFQGSVDTLSRCQDLWKSVFSLFTTLLQQQGATALEAITDAVQNLWPSLAGNIYNILGKRFECDRDLYVSCLQFLSFLFGEEGKLQGRQLDSSDGLVTLTQLLDKALQQDVENKDEQGITAGSKLCKALIGVYDHSILKSMDHKNPNRIYASTALRNLLAVCVTAKQTALELGLVEDLIEYIKQTHAKINMEALQVGKPTTKKKEDPLVAELVMTFDLLRNFLHQNLEAKMASYYCGLHNIIHRLWAWCQMDPTLMSSTLSLLATYTAKCPTASSSLAYTNPSAPSSGKTTQQLSTNSLVHCLIKQVSKEGMKSSSLKAIFGLLATLTLSSECRNIIFKSNFLREFTDLNPNKTKKSKQQHNLEIYWLELFVNLSFSVEGQQMILKTADTVDLMLDFMDCVQDRQRECSVLIIRNMCCHTSNKPKLLSNDKLLPRLLACLEDSSDKVKIIASSALWALIYNNQKAKVVMKNANILPKLQETINNINNCRQTEISEKCRESLQLVIAAVTD